jgi:redox-sensitive bicupin YhaK (pirin superfamily)
MGGSKQGDAPGGQVWEHGRVIEYRSSGSRFRTSAEGRTTWHSFSFGRHYDATNVGFARLVALNDEHLPPGTGYPDHPHADLEIVSWVLEGALRHTSTVGSAVVGPGQVQRLSAGSGVVHSEVADGAAHTRFLQAWVRPDEPGLQPGYLEAHAGQGAGSQPGWTCLADGDGRGVVPLASRGTTLHVGHLTASQGLALPDAPLLHLQVTRGRLLVGERTLADGDAARLLDEGERPVTAEGDAEVLVWGFTRRPDPS